MVKIFHRYLNSNLFVLPMFLVILAKNSLEDLKFIFKEVKEMVEIFFYLLCY